MDLNHIELPAYVVAELYRNSLVGSVDSAVETTRQVEISEEPIAIEEKVGAPWRSLGDNQKHILVVVKSGETAEIPGSELQFLTGVLSACKLNIADVAIININEQEATYKELTTYFKSRIVLLFDVEPSSFGLPMSFPQYQIQAFANNSFLYAPALKQLENDQIEKRKLWVCLKRLFNLF